MKIHCERFSLLISRTSAGEKKLTWFCHSLGLHFSIKTSMSISFVSDVFFEYQSVSAFHSI